jgi:hypothetical protein
MTTDHMSTETLPNDDVTTVTVKPSRTAIANAPEDGVPATTLSHSRRTALIIAVSGLAVLAVVVGGLAVAQAIGAQATFSTLCFSRASTSSSYITAAQGAVTNPSTRQSNRRAADPVDVCASVWRVGEISLKAQSGPDRSTPTGQFAVPGLVACTMANGVGAAFPREGSRATVARFCGSMGLTAWSR